MEISPICNFGKLKPYCTYKIIEEGRDWYLTKNGQYIPKNFTGRRQLTEKEKEDQRAERLNFDSFNLN